MISQELLVPSASRGGFSLVTNSANFLQLQENVWDPGNESKHDTENRMLDMLGSVLPNTLMSFTG